MVQHSNRFTKFLNILWSRLNLIWLVWNSLVIISLKIISWNCRTRFEMLELMISLVILLLDNQVILRLIHLRSVITVILRRKTMLSSIKRPWLVCKSLMLTHVWHWLRLVIVYRVAWESNIDIVDILLRLWNHLLLILFNNLLLLLIVSHLLLNLLLLKFLLEIALTANVSWSLVELLLLSIERLTNLMWKLTNLRWNVTRFLVKELLVIWDSSHVILLWSDVIICCSVYI